MDTSSEKNFLGLDWGKKNIGVALAHAETAVALRYRTLTNTASLFALLEEIIRTEAIGTVVIGIPSYVDPQAGAEARSLGQALKARFGVKLAFENEMFTTKMAEMSLIAMDEKAPSKNNDQEAARLILQSWLDKQRAL